MQLYELPIRGGYRKFGSLSHNRVLNTPSYRNGNSLEKKKKNRNYIFLLLSFVIVTWQWKVFCFGFKAAGSYIDRLILGTITANCGSTRSIHGTGNLLFSKMNLYESLVLYSFTMINSILSYGTLQFTVMLCINHSYV